MTNVEELCAAVTRGQRFDFLFFWGHSGPAYGPLGAECLSQWYLAPFTHDDIQFPTAEHALMLGKAKLFGDKSTERRILTTPSPREAKDLGRGVLPYDDTLWTEKRQEVAIAANAAKFSQNPKLREYLLSTGDKVLVEASPYDKIWGIGLRSSDSRAKDPRKWRGRNLLGFTLMAVRATLR